MKQTTFHQALRFIATNPGCLANELAEHLWPDANMHTKCSNQGHGACWGKAAWLCGGSLAGKLIKKGWVRSGYIGKRSGSRCVYEITQLGRDELKRLEAKR